MNNHKINSPKNQVGIIVSIALVVGNMIGSGVFLLPSVLAPYGGISIFGWIFTATGAFFLARVFSYFSKIIPNTSGGPYVYSKKGLGEFMGFIVGWGFWISLWTGNAAIATAFVSYLSVFFPILETHSILASLIGLAAIWFLTWINMRGIKEAGAVQVITTILKVIPLLLVAIFGIFLIHIDNFRPFNSSNLSAFEAISTTATLTLWAFIGMESATIPAKNIKNPDKTIPKATMIGTLVVTVIYIFSTMTVMGMIPADSLKVSSAPFADAASLIWGGKARYIIAAGATISTFGALNGFILMTGQIPYAVAQDNLFPKIFGKPGKKGTPIYSLLISGILVSVLMTMNFTKSMVESFHFIILLATVTILIPYLFSSISYLVLALGKHKTQMNTSYKKIAVAILAASYSFWAILGSGFKTILLGSIIVIVGVVIYFIVKRNNLKTIDKGND